MSTKSALRWTATQRAYEQALEEGPTAALERFRIAFEDRAPGPLSKGDKIVGLAEVLGVKMHQDTPELQRAMAGNCSIVSFLLSIMAEPDYLRHYLVSAKILLDRRNTYPSSCLCRAFRPTYAV